MDEQGFILQHCLNKICVFFLLYTKALIFYPGPAAAQANNMRFLISLWNIRSVNEITTNTRLKALFKYTWCLSDETITSLFLS